MTRTVAPDRLYRCHTCGTRIHPDRYGRPVWVHQPTGLNLCYPADPTSDDVATTPAPLPEH